MDETVGQGYATREDIRRLEDGIDSRMDNLEGRIGSRIDNLEDRIDSRIDKLDNRLWLLLATVLVSAVAVIFKGTV